MLALSFASLVAALLIGGLFLLAVRNRQQGWRKQRRAWWQIEEITAVAETATPQVPLQHLGDLSRLQHSLADHVVTAPVEVVKVDHLTPSR